MKKIMKKALSLALALVMMLSLAPVTAWAEDATTQTERVEVEANDTITTDGTGVAAHYVYYAPVAADYEIVVTGEFDSFGYTMIHPMTGMPMDNYAYEGELVMYAYETDEVEFSMFDYESQELTVTITMIEGTEVEDSVVDEDVTQTERVEVEANDTITTDGTGVAAHYVYYAPVAADYEIVVTGEFDSFGYSMIHPMTGMPMDNYAYEGELVMYAYETDEVEFSMFDYESQELTVTITMIEGTEVEAGDVVLEAVEVEANDTVTTDGTGVAVNYVYYAPVAADYEIVVTGTTDSFGYSMIHPMTGMPMDNYAYEGELVMYSYGTDVVEFSMFDYESQELTVTITMIEGTEVVPEAVEVEANDTITTDGTGVAVNYVYYAPEIADYEIVVTGAEDTFGYTIIHPLTGMPMENYAYEGELVMYSYGTDVVEFSMFDNESQELTITINKIDDDNTGTDEDENVEGSLDNPYEITENGTYTAVTDWNTCYYKWVATADGVLTITISGEDAAAYKEAYVYTLNDEYMDREFQVTTNVTEVKAGDVVIVAAYAGSGSLDFKFDFKGTETDSPSGEGTGAPVAGEKIKEGYFYNYQTFEVGKEYDLCPNADYDVTLYVFEPTEVGTYTFKVTNGKVGYYGTNLWYPFNEAALTDTVAVNYTDETLQSSIIIGVSEANLPTLTITAGEVQEEVVIPEITLGVSADAYIFNGDASKLQYVDIEGSVENKAVYASDGYYHLNTTDGPILLVDLTDDIVNLSAATASGKIVIVDYDENGEIIRTWNYNDVIDTCVANSDSKTGLYPLTSELMSIYKVYGEQQGWYTETGYVSSLFANPGEDAWMFACQYIPNAADGTIETPPVVVPLPKPDKDDSASAGATPGAGEGDSVDSTEDVVLDTKDPDMKDIIEEKIEQAIREEKPVTVPTTNEDVVMEFNPVELKEAGDFKINVTVAIKDDVKDETVAKNENITADIFVLKVEFSHDGELPGTATINITLPEKYHTYEKLYYYEIMADGSLRYECDAIVKDGKAIVKQNHCSDYVLLTEKIVEDTTTDTTTPDESPKTGDSSNIALWVAILGLGVVAIAGSVVMKKREF